MTTDEALREADEAGKKLVDDWFIAYNDVDGAAHRALIQFPLVSFGGARTGRDNLSVAIRHEAGDWGNDQRGQGVLYRDEQWDHSIILRQETMQLTTSKTHVLSDFTRNLADGTAYGLGLSRLTIGTRDAVGWWIRVLSSCGLRDPDHPAEDSDESVTSAARTVIEGVVEAINARDLDRLRSLCHFPFVRIPGNEFVFLDDAGQLTLPDEDDPWARSEIARLNIPTPQAGDKAVVDIDIRRYDRAGNELEPEGAVCLVTRHDDRWGLQLCSTRTGHAGLP